MRRLLKVLIIILIRLKEMKIRNQKKLMILKESRGLRNKIFRILLLLHLMEVLNVRLFQK